MNIIKPLEYTIQIKFYKIPGFFCNFKIFFNFLKIFRALFVIKKYFRQNGIQYINN